MKVLITSGGTEEPIDGVRYITNFSTGRTGAVLAEKFDNLGADVLLLHGHRSVQPEKKIKKDSFTTFQDLDKKLKSYLESGQFDSVIHLAAVSDYSVDLIETSNGNCTSPKGEGKLSSAENIKLHLKKNYKILDRIKNYSPQGKEMTVTGFKLTDTDSDKIIKEAVIKILEKGKIDFLVQNNLRDINKNKHPAKIYSKKGNVLFKTETKNDLAETLFNLLKGDI